MEITVNRYNLPDIDILYNYRDDCLSAFWLPDKTYVVLGISNKPEDSLNIDNIISDNVPVLKRPSGGEAVVLTPKTIVIAAISDYQNIKSPKEIFKKYNTQIIDALSSLDVKNLCHKGISDIAIGEKKILGSSIYRTKEKIFYQAVLNVSESTDIFERYLKHPKKEPDYRKGRVHGDFVTSLFQEGYKMDIESILDFLELSFK